MHNLKVTVVKTIQLRTEILDENGKVQHGWNKRFMIPSVAADYWVSHAILDWQERKYGDPLGNGRFGTAYGKMTQSDYDRSARLEKRLKRIVTAKFKQLLK